MERSRITVIGGALVALSLAACDRDLAKAEELFLSGDVEGAAAIYEARLASKPGDAAGTIGVARARYTAALGKAKTGEDTTADWRKVVPLLDAAVLVDPAPEGMDPVGRDVLSDALFRLGMHCFGESDPGCAADALAKAEENGKKSAELYAALARSEAATDKTSEAFKDALKAAKLDPNDAALFRDAAGWADEASLPWVHHAFWMLAEKAKPSGMKYRMPGEITKELSKKYPALNMINDTLGYFLSGDEITKTAWDGLLEREAVIGDLDKFVTKKPPAAFAPEDRVRLAWVVYHYYNTTGVVFATMGDETRAKAWIEKAIGVAGTGKVAHPALQPGVVDAEIEWAASNLELVK